MENIEIAKIFYEISEILKLKGEDFKSRAYFNAARRIERIDELREFYEKNELEKIPGIGKNLAKKIIEYFETGKISYLEKIKKELPEGIEELLKIPGVGPKTALFLYRELRIKSLEDLERAIESHEIRRVKTEKLERNLERGLKILKTGKKRILLSEAFKIVEELSGVIKNFEVAGSFRRRKETIGDLDIILTEIEPNSLRDFQILAKGEKKITAIYENIHIDFRIVKKEEYGASLQYFTGSKEHNIRLRRIAQKKGYKLNEYGLFEGNRRVAITEEDIYKKLGMPWIPPELRENMGEIEAAMKNRLPEIVDLRDIKGDLHIHTEWSDGLNSIENIVKKAKELNYEYIAITDHTYPTGNGLTEKRLLEQWDVLESYDEVLKGVECDILRDGSLSLRDNILEKADLVIASVHGFKPTTETILKAMENENIDVIGHPTGRLIGVKTGYDLDMEKIFEKAAETKTALEINAYPRRLDLRDIHIKKAKEYGVKFSIGTDSHSIKEMSNIIFGVYTARRGWAEKKDILNCMGLKELKDYVHSF